MKLFVASVEMTRRTQSNFLEGRSAGELAAGASRVLWRLFFGSDGFLGLHGTVGWHGGDVGGGYTGDAELFAEL
jgi:hypothetical protein